MNITRMMAAGLVVGLSSLALTGCKEKEPEATAAPAAVQEQVEGAMTTEHPETQKPKDHPAH